MDLIVIFILAAVIAPLLGFGSLPDVASVPLGLPFLLLFPGYALTAALYPRRHDLEPLERVALSFGLSLAAVPLVALALNYSPWGVQWRPLLAFISLLTVLSCAAGLLHRRLIPAPDRFALGPPINLTGRVSLSTMFRAALTAAVLAPLAALAVALIIGLATERNSDTPYTEFYLLGPNGRPDSLPSSLMLGDEVSLTTGIVNREGEKMVYSVSVSINGIPAARMDGIRLEPGQRRLRPLVFRPGRVGDGQLVQFDLYTKESGGRPYRTIHIWLNVLQPVAPPPPVLAEEQTPEPEPPPMEEPVPTPEPEPPQVHVVAPGEYLTLIARRYGVSLTSVMAANPLENPDIIHPQQKILIPPGTPTSESE